MEVYNLAAQSLVHCLVLITSCVDLLIILPPSSLTPLCFKHVYYCLVYGNLHNLIKVQRFNPVYWKLIWCRFNVQEKCAGVHIVAAEI